MIGSIAILAIVGLGNPVYSIAKRKSKDGMSKLSSLRTIVLSLTIPLFAGLSFACMAAKVAACSGWVNPGFIWGLIAGIVCFLLLIYLIPNLYQCESKLVIGVSSLIICLLSVSSIFISTGLNSWDSVDYYHHPIYVPIDTEWVNTVIAFVGRMFPMEDYPVISIETTIYSPESSFLWAFILLTEIAYGVVAITSIIAVRKSISKSSKKRDCVFSSSFI